MDVEAFRRLRETPLHQLGPQDWPGYYAAMAAWLNCEDAAVREGAIERLAMAVFRAEPRFASDAEALARCRDRAAWLFDQVEDAQGRYAGVLPAFLLALRWHADDARFHAPLMDRLAALRTRVSDTAIREMIDGSVVLTEGRGKDDVPDLDHPSAYVRGCVAHAIGKCGFGDPQAFDATFLADLTAREIARPGVAGPFWSGWAVDGKGLAFDPLDWMLDMIERRNGPEPPGLPFNGIDFHVHELADHSPAGIRRLLAAGRTDLALMAATETRAAVADMAEILADLGDAEDAAVAAAAHQHLARYYRTLHPRADPQWLRMRRGWRRDADLTAWRQGSPESWRDLVLIEPSNGAARFDEARAWALIDEVLPPALRGVEAEHWLAPTGSGPAPYRLGDAEHIAFESGASIELRGDPDTRFWSRIEIHGRGLQERWRPFDLLGGAEGRTMPIS